MLPGLWVATRNRCEKFLEGGFLQLICVLFGVGALCVCRLTAVSHGSAWAAGVTAGVPRHGATRAATPRPFLK